MIFGAEDEGGLSPTEDNKPKSDLFPPFEAGSNWRHQAKKRALVMVQRIWDNIFCFPISLPKSPLKYLNCYVIKSSQGKNLLIDTGYALPESRRDLESGLRELELEPGNTDVFLTHIHADHTGNARYLQSLGYKLLMGERDYQGVLDCHRPHFYGARQKAVDAGAPEDVLDAMFVHNPSPIQLPELFEAQTVRTGEILRYGGHELECLATYGHSPGHISLYDRENEILFLGDHVLFDITPNIVLWTKEDDALGEYLENLRKVQRLPVRLALPAHRTTGDALLSDRIEQLLYHHEQRVQEIFRILGEEPGLTAYQTAARMKWRLDAPCWDAFPPSQKYFATCECMAHLQHMCFSGLLAREKGPDGIDRYRQA